MSKDTLKATVSGFANPVEVITGTQEPLVVMARLIVDNDPTWIDVKVNRALRVTVRSAAIVALWVAR